MGVRGFGVYGLGFWLSGLRVLILVYGVLAIEQTTVSIGVHLEGFTKGAAMANNQGLE